MADVLLEVTIADAHVTRVLSAIDGYAASSIDLRVAHGEEHNWSYAVKGADTNKQFGERFLRQIVRAFVRCYELNFDISRYTSDIDGVSPPSQSVPDEIVT